MEPPESAQTNAGFWSLLVNETRFDKAHLLVERASGDVEQIALDQQDLSASWILGNMLRIDIPVSASPVKALYHGVTGRPDACLLPKTNLATEGAMTSLPNTQE